MIEFNVDIAPLTTFGLHAAAACVARYTSVEELMSLLSTTHLPRPFKPIGQGSNLLFTSDYPGTLLISNAADASFIIHHNGKVLVEADAGLSMDTLIEECCRKNLWGLENLSGIPGTVGASAVQNVGAYGVEAGDVIDLVTAIDTLTLQPVDFTPDMLHYGYRDSLFKHSTAPGRYIITKVVFRLSSVPTPKLGYAHLHTLVDPSTATPMDVRDAVISLRDSKLPSPAFVGSAGSFFKNPVIPVAQFTSLQTQVAPEEVPHYPAGDDMIKVPAAWLIDRCGLKGFTIGGAAVWHKQPLVIVNASGSATPQDVVALENHIIDTVRNRFGITLSPEVEHLP